MNPRPDGLGPSPMPLAPSPLDPHGYPTAINTGPGSYPYDHPFDYPREGSPDLESPGDTSNQASPMRSPTAKRGKKVEMACHFCRGRKLKCDGIQPRCQHCSRRGQICTWDSHVRRRGPGLKNKSKDVKGGVSKRRESVSTTSAGRSTTSPKTPARRSFDDLVSAYRGPAEALTPDGEFSPFFHPSVKGEDVDGDVPMTTGTNPPFAPPYPPTNEYTQIPSTTTSPQDPYPQTHYPGQQQTQYGPPSPPIRRVIPMSRTPSSSLAGAMGTDPNYSAYPSDNNQGSPQDSAWRRHSIAGGQCANPAAYISETTGGGAAPIAGAGTTTSSSASAAYHWDRDNAGGNGPSSYAYPPASAPAQYFNGQAVHGYPQQQQQQQQQYHTPSSPPSMGYGQQQQYAQPRGYATSRDHHHQQQHQHQPQVSPPMPGYEGGWFGHAGGPGQAWTGHVGHASADLSSGGDSVAHDHHHERLHDPSSSFAEIRVQGSVSPSQETDPSSYRAGRSTSGTVSSSSTHSSPAQVANNLYHLHPISTTTAAVVDMRNRPAPPVMQTSSSVDNDLAESLINLAHGPPATGMVRRVSSVTANSGSESGGTAVPMAESYTMASTASNDSASHQRTSSSEEGSWAEGRSIPRANNPATTAVGHAPATIGLKNALGTNSPHSGHEVVY
ncbi:hypothetical protein FRC05_010803 [Tulasnella sp. 425]|nr:hypothetical protein FRC05_010803 [Tulasnella sp. 425]